MADSDTAAPLRLAFLGCGFATRLHSRTLRGFAGVTRAYASRDAARAEEYRSKYGGMAAFGSYEAAIESPAVDLVLVATPPASHLELALAALAAGKHVIIEKPPLLRSGDFDALESAARAADRRVFVAENYFYKPMAEALRALIGSGELGDPRILTINAMKQQSTGDWRDDPASAGGGALFEGGIHWVNFMASLGLTVKRVQAFRPGSAEGPERSMIVVFEYEGGAVGTLYYSWEIGNALKGLRLSALYGTEGAATFETNGLILAVRGRRRRLRMPHPADLLGYRAMFQDFFEAIRTGTEPRFDLTMARRDLELVEAAYASLSTTERSSA